MFFVWLRITDTGSVPKMRIWSIVIIKSYLKLCLHLSRCLFSHFSYSVQNVQANSHEIWAFKRLEVIHEYHKISAIPPPFSLLVWCIRLVLVSLLLLYIPVFMFMCICTMCRRKKSDVECGCGDEKTCMTNCWKTFAEGLYKYHKMFKSCTRTVWQEA